MELTLQEMKSLSALMDHALDLDEESRVQWLTELSNGEHATLHPHLVSMLDERSRSDSLFLQVPVKLNASAFARSAHRMSSLEPGARVGAYVLRRPLGHGGMGVVWLADRADGALTRQVALKLPAVHLTKSLADRFARERDILAQLNHPNIARLYDAGVSDTGQPYLALEYVEGKTITEHCDAMKLSIAERLQRFLRVAAAVQYAHANLVIHRDLKPSNILVSDAGQVHLLDFGIAKLLHDPTQPVVETELTMLAGRALTLDYASPEQVNAEAISTASDVYSMGVVLYQLLTGQKPYQLKRGSRAELEEAILSGDFSLPSDVVRRGNDVVAAFRGLSRDRLARALVGDLDTITGKAMKKNPAERYATVAALAHDIERHLNGLPVEAQPDSWRYRWGKFVARHRLAVGAATAVTVALFVGFGTALWQADVATQNAQRADAEAASARAERARADSEAVAARRESERADAQARVALAQAARADEQAEAAQAAAQRADRESIAARREAQRADAQALAARREAQRADEEAISARSQAAFATVAQNFLSDRFTPSDSVQKAASSARMGAVSERADSGLAKRELTGVSNIDTNATLFGYFSDLNESREEFARSVRLHEQAATEALRAHGKESKQYAVAALDMAWAQRLRTPSKPPISLVEEATEILKRVSPGSDEHAQALYLEAEFVLNTDPRRALVAARESVRMVESRAGDSKWRGVAQRALGYAYRSLGDMQAATHAFAQATKSFAHLQGATGLEVGVTKAHLGMALQQEFQQSDAENTLRDSVDILRIHRGDRVDWNSDGNRLSRVRFERGRSSDAEAKMRAADEILAANDAVPSDIKRVVAIEILDMALARGQLDSAQKIASNHQYRTPGLLAQHEAGVFARAARVALEQKKLTEARQAIEVAKTSQRQRSLPFDTARDVALVAAELAAAEGNTELFLAEYADLRARFPLAKYSTRTRLLIDLSKARSFASLKRWSDVNATLADWVGKPLAPNQELPVYLKGELFLLAGEAAIETNLATVEKWLREASEVIERHHGLESDRLARVRKAMSQVETNIRIQSTRLDVDTPNKIGAK
jgi:eukaryotic-like serine/threonine-protein kinase